MLTSWPQSIQRHNPPMNNELTKLDRNVAKHGVFISHVSAEREIAFVVQKFVRLAFNQAFPVFVSSDGYSIPGGEGWWQFIRDEIKKRQAVLVLLSDESANTEWINFEAGVADGGGARVIPIAIKGYRFEKLDFPLKGFQGRYADDMPGILFDISAATGIVAGNVSTVDYLTAVRAAEERVIYRSLIFRPILTHFNGQKTIMFEMENQGNVDMDLIFAEVRLPSRVLAAQWRVAIEVPPIVEVDLENSGSVVHARYFNRTESSSMRPDVRTLLPVLTRSMGVRRLRDFRFPLSPGLSAEVSAIIYYQLHARNYYTIMEKVQLRDVVER
jgi:hypothetical protein